MVASSGVCKILGKCPDAAHILGGCWEIVVTVAREGWQIVRQLLMRWRDEINCRHPLRIEQSGW